VITLRTSSMALGVLAAAIIMGMLPAPAWGDEQERPAWELLSIGQPKPSAIGLRVWTNKEPGQAFHEGDRLVVTCQADRDACLTVLGVSSEGNVTVLFPNKDTQACTIEKGKPYTLFGDDSRLRIKVGKKTDKPALVFYVSTTRPALDSFKPEKKTGVITISGDSGKEIRALKGIFEAMAGEEGFNRVLFPLNGPAKTSFEVNVSGGAGRLMGGSRLILKKLPTPVDSTPPETVTGVQGVKPETAK
jgi:hypothetical protein